MSVDDPRQAILDAEHLRLLSIFYWVSGCCTAVRRQLDLRSDDN